MKLLQWRKSKTTPNKFYIEGTNQFLDFFISASCWTDDDIHYGVKKAALKLYLELRDKLELSLPVILDGYSMGGSIAIELGRILTNVGYVVSAEVRGAYPIYKDRIIVDYDLTITDCGNDPVPMLFSRRLNYPVDGKLVHIGPDRIKGEICFKDHTNYERYI